MFAIESRVLIGSMHPEASLPLFRPPSTKLVACKNEFLGAGVI